MWQNTRLFNIPAPYSNWQDVQDGGNGTWFMWCLAFVQTGYVLGNGGRKAIESWRSCPEKFPGELPPAGVESIVWWDWSTDGHVAVSMPDGSIVSSPMNSSQGGGHIVEPSLAAFNAKYPNVKYLGWSTCLGNVGTDRILVSVDTNQAKPEINKKESLKMTDLILEAGSGKIYNATSWQYQYVGDVHLADLLNRRALHEANPGSYASDPFNAEQIDIMKAQDDYARNYVLNSQVVAPIVAQLGAIFAAIQASGAKDGESAQHVRKFYEEHLKKINEENAKALAKQKEALDLLIENYAAEKNKKKEG